MLLRLAMSIKQGVIAHYVKMNWMKSRGRGIPSLRSPLRMLMTVHFVRWVVRRALTIMVISKMFKWGLYLPMRRALVLRNPIVRYIRANNYRRRVNKPQETQKGFRHYTAADPAKTTNISSFKDPGKTFPKLLKHTNCQRGRPWMTI